MTPAVLYMRCSGMGQVDGDTWDRQQDACRKYADAHEIEIVAEYRDEGLSGKTELEGRAGLAACLERVENNGVKLVLCESADRLARDSMIAELIVRQFQKAGVRVIAGGVDLTAGDDSNPTAKLIRQILASVAEFDRCVTVLKLKAARDRMKAKTGKCEGQKAFGHYPGEAVTLTIIQDLSRKRQTPTQIARRLNELAIPARLGGKWHGASIHKILRRKV
jgi:DNA invertase Pin-like site-specific DNA recombinase